MNVNLKKPVITTVLVIILFLTGLLYTTRSEQHFYLTYSIDPGRINSALPDSQKYIYVGAEKCASVCHNNKKMGFQYEIIRKTELAEAYEILKSRKAFRLAREAHLNVAPFESEVCLKCHITGGDLDTTFFASTYRKEDGITCEACHKGPYKAVSFLPGENDCLRCHNNSVHKVPGFNFKKRSEKIAHSRPPQKNEI